MIAMITAMLSSNVFVKVTSFTCLMVTMIALILHTFMYCFKMFSQACLTAIFITIIALIAFILDTFMFIFNMFFKTNLPVTLEVTLFTIVGMIFMF